MATKTFRTIYLDPQTEDRLVNFARKEQTSVSKFVRMAVNNHMKKLSENGATREDINIQTLDVKQR